MASSANSKTTAYSGMQEFTLERQRCWNRCSTASGLEQSHPMFVMSVKTLLTMNELQPHEAVKEKLIEWQPGMGAVLFCSHTWLKCASPDNDENSKFKLLADFLRRVLDGKVGDINIGASTYYGNMILKGKKMRQDLAEGYIWLE